MTACLLDLSPSDPRRWSTGAGCWRGGNKEGVATDWRSHSEGDRVDLLLMASGQLILTKVLTMSGLNIGGKRREADYKGVCAVTYKKLNKDG